jgi:hypothetical protein
MSLVPFPDLPDPPNGTQWSGAVNRAYDVIRSSLRHARALALQEDGADRTRVLVVVLRLQQLTIPLLQQLVDELSSDDFSRRSSQALGGVLAQLEKNAIIETERQVIIYMYTPRLLIICALK